MLGPFAVRGWRLTVAAWVAGSAYCLPEEWAKDPSFTDHFAGVRSIGLPPTPKEKTFFPNDRKAGFTYFRGVKDIRVTDGKLTFTVAQDEALLGWGNYLGRQPVDEIISLWEQRNEVVVRLRQTGARSLWQITFWADGKAISAPRYPRRPLRQTIEGTQWQEVTIASPASSRTLPVPDGMQIAISAAKGDQFTLEWLKVVQPLREGYLRREFSLPRGKIWKAVADVGASEDMRWDSYRTDRARSVLYINGQRVRRGVCLGRWGTVPVEVSRYLTSGRNCVSFHGSCIGYSPFIFLKLTVIMESGDTVAVNTPKGWKYSPQVAPGWQVAGFDDSSWLGAQTRNGRKFRPLDQHQLPADHGLIEPRNPFKRDLFYADTKEVILNVETPRGLRDRSPSLEYALARADDDGGGEILAEGRVTFFDEVGVSLIYRLNLGSRQRGVYTIALRLRDEQGEVIAERPREPLVVLRGGPLKVVNAKDYTGGLDLELEHSIDFTDPDDPHPWVEGRYVTGQPMQAVTTPRIVRRDDLVYREMTGHTRMSWLGYRLGTFKHPGDFYLVELEYPDDADRVIELHIATTHDFRNASTNSQTGIGAETGGKFYRTGKMQKLRAIHVADTGVNTIDIVNVADGRFSAHQRLYSSYAGKCIGNGWR